MKHRIVFLLLVATTIPLLMGGGAFNPPSGLVKVVGPAVTAYVVLDPHDPGVTEKAGRASILLQKGPDTTGAVFQIPDTFLFTNFGCDVSKNDLRFIYSTEHPNRLINWIPQAVLTQLFADIGITISPTNVPVITDIDNADCAIDPENPLLVPTTALPGTLSFQAVVQFLTPARK